MLTTGCLERTRLLPYRGEVLVAAGDLVEPWTPVAKIGYLPGKMIRVDIASNLMMPPERITDFMVKKPGDAVVEGGALARGNLFWEIRESKSPVRGIVGLVSRYLGHVYVREPIDLGNTEPAEIDVAAALGVKPFMVREYLNVSVGKMVVKDQPVASRRKSWGEPVTHVMAPTYGIISRLDTKTGVVTITPLFRSTDVLAYVQGRVAGVLPDEGVVVRCDAMLVNGVFGIGGETFGELHVAIRDASDSLQASDVTEACGGKVVIGGSTATWEAIEALAAIRAKALVVGYLPVDVIQRLAPGLNMGITGKEDVPLTVILTEGFRPAPMSPDVFLAFRDNAGKTASCNGTTHIRAGVIRPEVIIPRSPPVDGMTAMQAIEAGTGGPGLQDNGIKAGLRVRLLRRPYAGLRGAVAELRAEKSTLESGIVALTCVVRLDDGRDVTIPRSNCTPE